MTSVFSCGFGVQSTAILGLACKGLIPMPDRAVFSDPKAESKKTYAHAQWCVELAAKHGLTIDFVSAGDIFAEALEFARRRANSGTKRYASIPLFIRNPDGTEGIMPRQCTSEYKLEPITQYHRREVLGLKPRARSPKTPEVDVWIGISADEERRATAPGRWREIDVEVGKDLLGDPVMKSHRKWEPLPWQVKTFPLLGYTLHPDRSKVRREEFAECEGWDREDCLNWLAKAFPDVKVPRSACVFCPYRTNGEWLQMKTEDPDEFARAVEFDREIRAAYATGRQVRRELAGVPYVHRKLVPLDQVDLTEPLNDRKGCGGLFSQEPDGICGV